MPGDRNGVVSWGVIGAGGIADRKTIPGLLAAGNCRLQAVMDVIGAGEVAARHGVEKHTAEIDDILNDGDIQAVYIATPVHLHLEQVRRAAAAGKHVLCEKPLARTAAEAAEVVRACREAGVLLQEGYMMKFHGAHRAIRELVLGGRVGRVTYMRAQLACWYPPIEGAWRQDPALGGGGALIDMATHLYDLLEFLAGRITKVFALTGRQVHSYQSEDASTTLLELAAGAHATVDCFYNVPDQASRTRLEIYGSRGSILAEGTIGQGSGGRVEALLGSADAAYDATQNKDAAAAFAEVPFEKVNPYAAECEYFADCILAGRPVELNNGENAVHIMEVTDAAYQSARTGRSCDIQ